jgi:hypothetical protein
MLRPTERDAAMQQAIEIKDFTVISAQATMAC